MLAPTPLFNMICQIKWTIIYVKVVLEQRCPLYLLFLNMKKNLMKFPWIWDNTGNCPFTKRHRSTRNDRYWKTLRFLKLAHSVSSLIKISFMIWFVFQVYITRLGGGGQKFDLISLFYHTHCLSIPYGGIHVWTNLTSSFVNNDTAYYVWRIVSKIFFFF